MKGFRFSVRVRYICYAFFIILGTLFIEGVVYNYHPLILRESVDIYLGSDMQMETEEYTAHFTENGIHIALKEPAYIQKAEVWYNGEDSVQLYLGIVKQNLFSVSSDEMLTDVYHPELGVSYTNIEKNIEAFMATVDEEANGEITAIRLFTQVEFNRVRMAFWAAVLVLACLFFDRWQYLMCHQEWVVAFVCCVLGTVTIYGQGILANGWDEQIHFQRAYELSYGRKTVIDDAVRIAEEPLDPVLCTTSEERSLAIQYVENHVGQNMEIVSSQTRLTYNTIVYLPMSAALWCARNMGFSFYWQFLAGKFANLFCYVALMCLAIKIIPVHKSVVAALALIPTQIFEASSYTYDSVMLGMLILGFCCWVNVMYREYDRKTKWYMLFSVILFGVGSLVKIVYMPLALLCCLYSRKSFAKEGYFKIYRFLVTTVFAVGLAIIVVPAIFHLWNDDLGWLSDSRGGATDFVLQLKNVLAHPLAYIWTMFRDSGKVFVNYVIGIEGLLNFGIYNCLGFPYAYLGALWLVMLCLRPESDHSYSINRKETSGIVMILIVMLMLIWTSMYLSFTPVGNSVINGVQARYYAPLLVPLLYLLRCHDKIVLRMEKAVYDKMALGIPTMLYLFGLYYVVLKPYVF